MIIGVHITMDRTWRGSKEEFENVFHYNTGVGAVNETDLNEIVDDVVSTLRPIFGSSVGFKRARVHGPTNLTKVEDVMLLVKDLTGTGSKAETNGLIPPEFTYVVQMYVGRGPKGGKQFLRKYFHSCVNVGGDSTDVTLGISALTTATRTTFQNVFESLKNVIVGTATWTICTPAGKGLPLNTVAVCLPYLHVRQFKR